MPEDRTEYVWRYRFVPVPGSGGPGIRWSELMQVVGRSGRGANTAPVHFDDDGAQALVARLAIANSTLPPTTSVGEAMIRQVLEATDVRKRFGRGVKCGAIRTEVVLHGSRANVSRVANLTIKVDDEILRRARSRAVLEKTSVNQVLSERLRAYAGDDPAATAWHDFLERGRTAAGSSGGRDWARDDLYQR